MFVIGTAGHVDHGKTALIEALTGINADRLPEEKKRGMTIDLGFAYFTSPDGEEIGVIDVPGHERFIRNMVAGAWNLDLALLVIAVDDGWMEQTEDHARVLYGMGMRRPVLVLTKCDLAARDQIDLVREDAEENFFRIFESIPDTVETSALEGRGIDDLKSTILGILDNAKAQSFPTYSTLYIDRVFSLQGTGTVITGSLSTGTITTGKEVTLLPTGSSARVRSIQSYYRSTETAFPVSRVAVNLQGVKRDEVTRGMCLTDDPGRFWTSKELIATIREYPARESGVAVKGLSSTRPREVEVAFGTFNCPAGFYRLDNTCVRLVLREQACFRWNQPVIVTGQGGSTPLAWGRIAWGGKASGELRGRIVRALSEHSPAELPDYADFHLRVFGYARRDAPRTGAGRENADGDARMIGDYIARISLIDGIKNSVLAASDKAGGTTLPELTGGDPYLKKLEVPLIEAVVGEMEREGKVIERRGVLFPPGKEGGMVSKAGKKILASAAAKEPEAITQKDLGIPGVQQKIRTLVREGLLVPLEGGFYYRPEAYTDLKDRILDGLSSGAAFSIPEAKERVGLSRKYIIPLLNRMEEDNLVRREGDQRVVV